jgi:outer membrane protein OmpA-like peptidoglycan-associated protein
VNLPQVKVGDEVVVKYNESILVEVKKPGTMEAAQVKESLIRAKPGEKPGGVAAKEVTVTATVEKIDKEKMIATLKGPEGKLVDVKVQNPKNLENVNVGDQVVITYLEALAISVGPAPKVMMFEEAALFDFDKAELKPEGKDQLKAYREKAQAELSRADKIRITGYTDNSGAADYNTKLSMQRAEAVRDYLISIGADPNKMEASGAGEDQPIADNSTKEGRAKNRRVEIELAGLAK